MEKPEKLGKYQIRSELGRGAMGVVYEAFDPQIERTVAIKTILKSSIDKREAEETFNRFRREARAAGRLSHPKIVSIYEYGEDEDVAYIVMELIHGKELKDYFDHEDRFSIRDSVRIVMQILDALDYSHSRGVVHRDIKPANILITDDGQIKIADFGIAKIDTSRLTQNGVVLGTPTYMSPEQFMGNAVDHRTDLYAAGVILYQFLTGQRPFNGSVITIMHQAVNQEAIPPSQHNPDVNKELDEVVKKAMAKRPEERFQSATEFMSALKIAAKATPESKSSARNADITLGDGHKAFRADETIVLPKVADSTDVRIKKEVIAWQKITNSSNAADFVAYLKKYPSGEYAELARMRIASLARIAAETAAAEEAARKEKEARKRAALEEKKRKEAELREIREKAEAQAKAVAEAELKRKQEAEEKLRLARQLEEIKSEGAQTRLADEARRLKEIEEQAKRAKEMSLTLTERAKKFTEVVSEREAAVEAERRMKLEAQRRLEEEVQRKKQAKLKRIAAKETAEDEDGAEEVRLREATEAVRKKELEEAQALAEAAERFKKIADEQAEQARKSNRYWLLIISAVAIAAVVVWTLIIWA